MGIILILVMLVSMFLCWLSLCLPPKTEAGLKTALVSASTQVLASGVILFTALMPSVACGAIARLCGCSVSLSMLYGLEAAVCIAMVAVRRRFQARVRDDWQIRILTNVMRNGLR